MHSGEAAAGQMNNMRSLHVCTHFNGEHVIRDLFLSLMKRYYTANMHLHMWVTVFPIHFGHMNGVFVCAVEHFSAWQCPAASSGGFVPSAALGSWIFIHAPQLVLTINKRPEAWMPGWGGEEGKGAEGREAEGGQIPAKVGGKQPVSKVTSPASVLCSSLWEKGEGRQEGFFLFSSFSFFSGRF